MGNIDLNEPENVELLDEKFNNPNHFIKSIYENEKSEEDEDIFKEDLSDNAEDNENDTIKEEIVLKENKENIENIEPYSEVASKNSSIFNFFNVTIIGFKSDITEPEHIIIPEQIDGVNVTRIGSSAFENKI